VLVAIRQHDYIAAPSVMAFPADAGDPASTRSDDVEQDQPFPSRPEQPGQMGQWRRLVRPSLGVLGAQEDGAI
jgi:hypothetical protein